MTKRISQKVSSKKTFAKKRPKF